MQDAHDGEQDAMPASAPARPRMSPKRREMGGATKTANTASITPQPQKT